MGFGASSVSNGSVDPESKQTKAVPKQEKKKEDISLLHVLRALDRWRLLLEPLTSFLRIKKKDMAFLTPKTFL
jgi:hypothetical protein